MEEEIALKIANVQDQLGDFEICAIPPFSPPGSMKQYLQDQMEIARVECDAFIEHHLDLVSQRDDAELEYRQLEIKVDIFVRMLDGVQQRILMHEWTPHEPPVAYRMIFLTRSLEKMRIEGILLTKKIEYFEETLRIQQKILEATEI